MKAWHTVIPPREDLRDGKPLDASEFAVHLEQVRDGRAPGVYQNPEQFFARTYMTKNLSGLAVETLRRLSGITTETSAVFNMSTQFGGGKTHALTLLYHLASDGQEASQWAGVPELLDRAGIAAVPHAAIAVFVGTEFDSITGRGGDDGTPSRRTPWGEIAFQLGGADGFATVAEHEAQMTAPGGDVIARMLPADRPCLILLDELMNYISRSRKSGMAEQFYNFVHNLSECARGRANVVLAVAIPASELEMSAEDQMDFERFKKLLDRLGKAVLISAESETSEIIRRRLFDWENPRALSAEGRVLLSRDAIQTCREYGDWVSAHRHEVPSWFPADGARAAFEACYPFHPSVLSVFERKWQTLPRFQQTRGVLRLLALWVARAYEEAYKGARHDPLITLGTAPLESTLFRAAMLEQLGEQRLETAITTDICGRTDSHAERLDDASPETVRKLRLNRKVATTIFFESNGGQLQDKRATLPEVRLGVGGPDTDLGFVEPALEALGEACYYLTQERSDYYFSLRENLNKRFADRRATPRPDLQKRVREEVQRAFGTGGGVEHVAFPEQSNQVPDRAAVTVVILAPEHSASDPATLRLVDAFTREAGNSARTFKNALIWAISDGDTALNEEMRKLLAWEDIESEQLRLDDVQQAQLRQNLERSKRDMREAVWRSYHTTALLGKDNAIRTIDLGLVHSSAAGSMTALILNRLRQDGEIVDTVSPNFLVRYWPPAFTEWSTLSVRDAFFASPQFPRLMSASAVQAAIVSGVKDGVLAYLGKLPPDEYRPFHFNEALKPDDVQLSQDMYIATGETAEAYVAAQAAREAGKVVPPKQPETDDGTGDHVGTSPGATHHSRDERTDGGSHGPSHEMPQSVNAASLRWSGEIPWQKWTNLYTKVLTRFSSSAGLKVTVTFEATPTGGVSRQAVEETRIALRELGLSDDVWTE